MAIRLSEFLAAFARAVVDAQQEIQRTQLGDLSQFFNDGSPITVDLKLPRVNPDTGLKESTEVQVPLAILVSHGGMLIREMQITMPVALSPIAETAKPKAARKSVSPTNQPHAWKPPEDLPVVSVSTVTGRKEGDAGIAQLTLRVAADDVTEGLARLLDHLNKVL